MLDRRGFARTRPTARAALTPLPRVLVALVAVAVVVVGCGTSTPTGTPGTTTPTIPAPTVVATSNPVSPEATEPVPSLGLPPTEAPVSSATTAACEPADLKVSHGLVEGAAGSRLTELVLVSGITCSIDAFPALGLRDANGAALIGGVSMGPGRIDVAPGTAYRSDIRLTNWCADEPLFPLALEVRVAGAEVAVTGTSFPEQGDMPPCSGGSGPILEGSAWVPSP